MPNHVKNVLKFKNLKPKDIDFILATISSPIILKESDIDEKYAIDFDKIIPEPQEIEDCPEDCRVESAKEAGISEDKHRPWFNWYKWHMTYWGTKWGAYDCYTKVGKSYVTFVFSTAWSAPAPILTKLTLLGYDIDYRYADEDYGNNCGIVSYSCEQGLHATVDSEMINPGLFARNLWDKY